MTFTQIIKFLMKWTVQESVGYAYLAFFGGSHAVADTSLSHGVPVSLGFSE